jgi:hypothetical protein
MPPASVVERMVLDAPQVKAACDEVARAVESEATGLAGERAFDSGQYAAGIRVLPTPGPGALVSATNKISRWTEEGTGVFGPRRQRIRPKRGKYLVFRVQESGSAPLASMSGKRRESGLIFATSVKGKPPQHVMEDASKRVAARLGLRWRDLR